VSDPAWPSTLPNFAYGLAEGDVDGMFIRSNNDAGVPKQRLRYTAVAVPISAQLELNRTQLATFNTFVATTIKHVLPFTIANPFTDSGTLTVRLTKRPKRSRTGFDQVTVSLDFEIMP
jgi:hypothetical protein